jgi:hypothetical protein
MGGTMSFRRQGATAHARRRTGGKLLRRAAAICPHPSIPARPPGGREPRIVVRPVIDGSRPPQVEREREFAARRSSRDIH